MVETRFTVRSQPRSVCHEQSIVKYFGALRMMREGPSEPAFRRRFQTTFMLLCLKGMVVSDKGKGLIERDKVSIKETNESEPLKRRRKLNR